MPYFQLLQQEAALATNGREALMVVRPSIVFPVQRPLLILLMQYWDYWMGTNTKLLFPELVEH